MIKFIDKIYIYIFSSCINGTSSATKQSLKECISWNIFICLARVSMAHPLQQSNHSKNEYCPTATATRQARLMFIGLYVMADPPRPGIEVIIVLRSTSYSKSHCSKVGTIGSHLFLLKCEMMMMLMMRYIYRFFFGFSPIFHTYSIYLNSTLISAFMQYYG